MAGRAANAPIILAEAGNGPADVEASMVCFFDRRDARYHDWLAQNPRGWVVNTRRRRDPSYVVLHRATCRSIKGATRAASENPFTGGDYVKVCSADRESLADWLIAHGFGDVSRECGLCLR